MPVFLVTREYQVCVTADHLSEVSAITDAELAQAIEDGKAHKAREVILPVNSVSQVNDDLLDEPPLGAVDGDRSARDILRHS
ncbi:hypothetical protein [Marinobacter sp. MBR-105]